MKEPVSLADTDVLNVLTPPTTVLFVLLTEPNSPTVHVMMVSMTMDTLPNVNHVETFVPLVKTETDVPLVPPTEPNNHLLVLANKDTMIATMMDLAVLVTITVPPVPLNPTIVSLVPPEELTTHQLADAHTEPPKSTKFVNHVTLTDVKPVLEIFTIVPLVKPTELTKPQNVHVLMVLMN